MVTEKTVRVNSAISVPEVRLIGVDGELIGVVKTVEALRLAVKAEVDLVEISPQADPPVCRLVDYGKFRYQLQKKAHEAKVRQKTTQLKEVKFRPATDDGDYRVKLKNLIRFLSEGDKAKVSLRFRGREITHQEFGMAVMERLKLDLEPYAVIEQEPRMEGRQMTMLLVPKRQTAKVTTVAKDLPSSLINRTEMAEKALEKVPYQKIDVPPPR